MFLHGKSQGQRSLAGCTPWGPEELDRTEPLSLTEWGREEFRLAARGCVVSSVGYGNILELDSCRI